MEKSNDPGEQRSAGTDHFADRSTIFFRPSRSYHTSCSLVFNLPGRTESTGREEEVLNILQIFPFFPYFLFTCILFTGKDGKYGKGRKSVEYFCRPSRSYRTFCSLVFYLPGMAESAGREKEVLNIFFRSSRSYRASC